MNGVVWRAGAMAGSTGGTAQVGDVALHYTVWGSAGPWLTLVHGGMMPAVAWEDQAARLSDVARVLTFDQRGYGASSTPAEGYSIVQRARDLQGLWDALDIDQSVLVGFSMGGFVAIETTLTAPERVTALLLAGTAAGLDEAQRDGFLARADDIEAQGSPFLAASFRGLAEFDRRADVSRISCPTIVVHGDADEALPPSGGRALQAQIAGSRLETFAGAGHHVHHEDPDRVAALLRELVAAVPT